MKVRQANRQDLPQIMAILNHEILNHSNIYHYHERTLQEIEDWFLEKEKENHPILVAVENDDIMGYATYGKFRNYSGYQFTIEHSIYVNPKFQKRGVGKKLLTELILVAKKQNYHVMIACIDAANQKSIHFHEKFDFIPSGNFKQVGYKFDKWLDIVFMQLMLKG